jgi:hypothetical protein
MAVNSNIPVDPTIYSHLSRSMSISFASKSVFLIPLKVLGAPDGHEIVVKMPAPGSVWKPKTKRAYAARGRDVGILLGQQAFNMFSRVGLVEVATTLSLETRNHPQN